MDTLFNRRECLQGVALTALLPSLPIQKRDDVSEMADQVHRSLRKAAQFFRDDVGANGGYMWTYSEDLTKGETTKAHERETIIPQPPGTPAVGMSFLRAYSATNDSYFLDAAKEVGDSLVRGQLRSGGWYYHYQLVPNGRRKFAYRVDSRTDEQKLNNSVLDDDTTTSCLRMLMRLDKALQEKDRRIHDAVVYGFESLQKVQRPNGGFPQIFSEPCDPSQYPVHKASYPKTWDKKWVDKNYRDYYTLNDDNISQLVVTLLEAAKLYPKSDYQKTAEKVGEFILTARMPEPQPIWAQQYDLEMRPVWARKSEPPAVVSKESQRILYALIDLYEGTGRKEFIEVVPRCIEYLRSVRLPDGKLSRFYELKTNRPLYFTHDYGELSYSDADLPTNYDIKVTDLTDKIERLYKKALAKRPEPTTPRKRREEPGLMSRVKAVLEAQDSRGRWVEDGKLRRYGADDRTTRVVTARTFNRNVELLCQFLDWAKIGEP